MVVVAACVPGVDVSHIYRDDMSEHAHEAVRRYYDHNTAAFEKFGQGATTIHRAVWGEGVQSREQAFAYLDELIAQEILELGASPAFRVLDLGCGLGASLVRLARRFPTLNGVGITISPAQAQRAGQLLAQTELKSRVSALEGDFVHLPSTLSEFDVAYAIESFVHCPDAASFFAAVRPHVRRGGRLVICDDFLQRAPHKGCEKQWVTDVQQGWMAFGIASVEATVAQAERAGFSLRRDRDLTPNLELRRFRDRMMTILLTLGRPLRIKGTRWGSWVGGDALQWALLSGLVEYHYLVFERAA